MAPGDAAGAGKVLVINDARVRLSRVPKIGVKVVDTAIDDGDADAAAVVAGVPHGAGVHGAVGVVVEPFHGVIDADISYVGIVRQARQSADRNAVGAAMNHIEPARQASAKTLDS